MSDANGQAEEVGQLASREDLVVCENARYGFENRWVCAGDVIDYRQVECFRMERWKANNSHLRRIKVYQLPARLIDQLLTNLNEQNTCTQLEIDCLELVQESSPCYAFKFLVIFSIESVAIVDQDGQKLNQTELLPQEKKPVLFLEASQLSTVHLGKSNGTYEDLSLQPLTASHPNRFELGRSHYIRQHRAGQRVEHRSRSKRYASEDLSESALSGDQPLSGHYYVANPAVRL